MKSNIILLIFVFFFPIFLNCSKPDIKILFDTKAVDHLNKWSKVLPDSVDTVSYVYDKIDERIQEVWDAEKNWPECIKKVFNLLDSKDFIIIEWGFEKHPTPPLSKGHLDAMARIKKGNAYLFPDNSLYGKINLYNVYAPEFYLLGDYISRYGLDKRSGPKKNFIVVLLVKTDSSRAFKCISFFTAH